MINLYWYEGLNLGDNLSAYIVKRLSGENVCFRQTFSLKHFVRNSLSGIYQFLKGNFSIAKKQMSFTLNPVLIAVGSLLESSTKRCICWGTGMAQPRLVPSGGRFIMTRGYLSRQLLLDSGFNVESDVCGDPALLMPLLYDNRKEQIPGRVGIIPHVSEVEAVKKLLGENNQFEVIDFRTKDINNTIDEILYCTFVYSSSLHGLILCHAYGIPCLWFRLKVQTGGDFKFKDHFSAIRINFYEPLSIEDIKKGTRLSDSEERASKDVIMKIQNELISRAPFKVNFSH